jgi:4-hydroxybenzoate polyprenyltransferase
MARVSQDPTGNLGAMLRHYSRYARLMRLHRPIGIWLLLWPTLWALWIASEGRPDQTIFIVLVLGTIVTRAAGCVINDFADRNIDGRVERTADRPLASGEVTSGEALLLFVALRLIALGLVRTLNRLALLLAVGGALVMILYPFTKRFFAAPQFVLGVAFAWGVPMAFAAQIGTVPRLAWLLFVAALVWVVVYDTLYAMADRDDDLEIGVRSTAILFGDLDRVFVAGLALLFLGTLVLVGRNAELGTWYYGGLAAAAAFAFYEQVLIRNRDPALALRAFLNNAWLGGAVFAGIALDYLFRAPAA